jgi:hypothetical protein
VKNKLVLIIFSVDKNDLNVLLDNENPLETNPGSIIDQSLRKLSEKYLQLHAEWLDFRLFDAYRENGTMYTAYTARVPNIIKNKQGRWYNIGEINDTKTQKLVYKASLQK